MRKNFKLTAASLILSAAMIAGTVPAFEGDIVMEDVPTTEEVFVVDEPAKRAMWDIVNSMDHPVAPFLISRGIDINHSVGFSLIGIVILCSMTVIGNMIRRFKNKG